MKNIILIFCFSLFCSVCHGQEVRIPKKHLTKKQIKAVKAGKPLSARQKKKIAGKIKVEVGQKSAIKNTNKQAKREIAGALKVLNIVTSGSPVKAAVSLPFFRGCMPVIKKKSVSKSVSVSTDP